MNAIAPMIFAVTLVFAAAAAAVTPVDAQGVAVASTHVAASVR